MTKDETIANRATSEKWDAFRGSALIDKHNQKCQGSSFDGPRLPGTAGAGSRYVVLELFDLAQYLKCGVEGAQRAALK